MIPKIMIKKEDAILSEALKAKIESNRLKALNLRNSKRKVKNCESTGVKKVKRLVDSGGGFLIENEDSETNSSVAVVKAKGAILGSQIICDECSKEFMDSYLYSTFGALVCDNCRDPTETHRLITKTDAKREYLLKDVDFTVREPPLKCIVKKNPQSSKWGDMKLYLELQVAERSLEVWGSEEKIQEEKDKRGQNREKAKQKKYIKDMKSLRKEVRSSLYKSLNSNHDHHYEEEQYNEDKDVYTKKCKSCGYIMEFEKM